MKDAKFAVPLEYLRKFWRTLDKPLNNCQVSLILTWSENCVLIILSKIQSLLIIKQELQENYKVMM